MVAVADTRCVLKAPRETWTWIVLERMDGFTSFGRRQHHSLQIVYVGQSRDTIWGGGRHIENGTRNI